MKRGGFGKDPGTPDQRRLPDQERACLCWSSPIRVNEDPDHFFPYLLPMTTLHER
jgi:hypothetical protein